MFKAAGSKLFTRDFDLRTLGNRVNLVPHTRIYYPNFRETPSINDIGLPS